MQVTRVLRVPAAAVIGIAALMLTAAATACGDSSGPNPTVVATTTVSSTPAITPPVITERKFLTPGDPGFPILTIADLLRVYPIVVVGQVDGVLQPFDPRPGSLGYSQAEIDALEASPKGGPIPSDLLARPPGSWTSIYSVKVTGALAGNISVGQSFALMQSGGVFESVAYENPGDPVILLGSTYLFFLRPFDVRSTNYVLPDGYDQLPEDYQHPYLSLAESRFLVSDGRLDALSEEWATYWGSYCGSCEDRSLAGRPLEEAMERIREAGRN